MQITRKHSGIPNSLLWLVAAPMAATVLQRLLGSLQISVLLDAIISNWRRVTRLIWGDFFHWLGSLIHVDLIPAPPQFDALTFGVLLLGSSLSPIAMIAHRSAATAPPASFFADSEIDTRVRAVTAALAFVILALAFSWPVIAGIVADFATFCSGDASNCSAKAIPSRLFMASIGGVALFFVLLACMIWYFTRAAADGQKAAEVNGALRRRRPLPPETGPTGMVRFIYDAIAVLLIVGLAYLMSDPLVYLQSTSWSGEPQWHRYRDYRIAKDILSPAITVLIALGFIVASRTNQAGIVRIVVVVLGVAIADRILVFAEGALPWFGDAMSAFQLWLDHLVHDAR